MQQWQTSELLKLCGRQTEMWSPVSTPKPLGKLENCVGRALWWLLLMDVPVGQSL